MIDRELAKVDRSGMLPAGVVLTGGCSKLSGMLEAAKEGLRLPAALGTSIGASSVIDRVNDPAMSTAIGLVLWGRNIRGVDGGSGKIGKFFSKMKAVDKLGAAVKRIFGSMKP